MVRWQWRKPENVYFLAALVLGLLFATLNPPFQVPDENTHFYRANQIAEGMLFGVEGKVIRSVDSFSNEIKDLGLYNRPEIKIDPKILMNWFFSPLNKGDKVTVSTPATVNYHSIMYFPQAFGIIAGKAFNFSPYKLLLFSRISSLFFGILLTTLSIKICPVRKWSLVYIGLLPMTLFLFGSVSADTFTISVCIFFASYVIYLKGRKPGRIEIVTLVLLTFSLAFLKPGYVFVCVIILLVPFFPENKTWDIIVKIVVILATITTFIVWVKISGFLEPEPFLVEGGVNASEQLNFVMMNPARFLKLIVSDLAVDLAGLVLMFIGAFGWVDIRLPTVVYIFYELSLGFILFFDNDYEFKSLSGSRVVLIASFLFVFSIIYVVFYFVYTPVGANFIQGFQGRYILPIASLVFFAFLNGRSKFQFRKVQIFIPFWVIGAGLSLLTILDRYFH